MSQIIHLTTFDTELGPVQLASTEAGVVCCTLPGAPVDSARAWLDKHLPGARIVAGGARNAKAVKAVMDYVRGKRTHFDDIDLDPRGTPFQLQVWEQLRRIPFGQLISYGELAQRVGRPGASRACGAANGANPLPLFVPCHRVIASDGTLGGFGGGLELKARLLQLEGSFAATKG